MQCLIVCIFPNWPNSLALRAAPDSPREAQEAPVDREDQAVLEVPEAQEALEDQAVPVVLVDLEALVAQEALVVRPRR
jgi:hypothetical protein